MSSATFWAGKWSKGGLTEDLEFVHAGLAHCLLVSPVQDKNKLYKLNVGDLLSWH